jgi:hypothetical protein
MKIFQCITHFFNYQRMNVKRIRSGIINSSS